MSTSGSFVELPSALQDLRDEWASLPGYVETRDRLSELPAMQKLRACCPAAEDLWAAMLASASEAAAGAKGKLGAPWQEHGADFACKQLRGEQHIVTLADVARWPFQYPAAMVGLVRPLLRVLAILAKDGVADLVREIAPHVGLQVGPACAAPVDMVPGAAALIKEAVKVGTEIIEDETDNGRVDKRAQHLAGLDVVDEQIARIRARLVDEQVAPRVADWATKRGGRA